MVTIEFRDSRIEEPGLLIDVVPGYRNIEEYVTEAFGKNQKDPSRTRTDGIEYSLASILSSNKSEEGYKWQDIQKGINTLYNRPLIEQELWALEDITESLRQRSTQTDSDSLNTLVEDLERKTKYAQKIKEKMYNLMIGEGSDKNSSKREIKLIREEINVYAKADNYRQLNKIAEELRDIRDLAERKEYTAKDQKRTLREVEKLIQEAREAQLHPQRQKVSLWSRVKSKVISLVSK